MSATSPLPSLADPEGDRVPGPEETGGEVVDAHVHLFPPAVLEAIWRWFDRHAWSVRYRLHAERAIEFLRARGVAAVVVLQYAHAPGMARMLNRFASELARAHPGFVLACGTVLPGEPDAEEVIREALGPLGLRGMKIHCHVQRIAPDDPRLDPVFRACVEARRPLVMHAGTEPALEGYGADPRSFCGARRVERVLERFPGLRLVVPHLGAGEFDEHAALLERHEGLYLDTTMAVAGYLARGPAPGFVARHARRLLYGTDFPQLPYAWDRELRMLVKEPLEPDARRALFSANARRLFGD